VKWEYGKRIGSQEGRKGGKGEPLSLVPKMRSSERTIPGAIQLRGRWRVEFRIDGILILSPIPLTRLLRIDTPGEKRSGKACRSASQIGFAFALLAMDVFILSGHSAVWAEFIGSSGPNTARYGQSFT
jgi:hypothetical protein